MDEYINASLVLTTEENYIKLITDRLGISPTQTRDKNDFKIREFACFEWVYSTGNMKVRSVTEAVAPILNLFGGKRQDIRSLLEETGGKCDIVIVISAISGDGPEVVLEKDIISFSNDIQAEIGFDLYYYDGDE